MFIRFDSLIDDIPPSLNTARFKVHSTHLVVNAQGEVFTNDTETHQIWTVTFDKPQHFDLSLSPDVAVAYTGKAVVFAGTGKSGHKDGPLLEAQFNQPAGLVFDKTGNMYVADTGNKAIRKITPEGIVSTVYQVPD